MRFIPFALAVILAWFISPNEARAQAPPTAAWGFEQGAGVTALDSSGNGNAGTLLQGTAWSAGRIGGGLTLDGFNDRVRVPDAASVDFTSAMTVSTWLKIAGPIGSETTILQKEASGPNWASYFMSFNSWGWLKFSIWVPGGYRTAQIATPFPDGEWVHVTASYDGSNIRLYLNGELRVTEPASGTITPSANALWIGGDPWGGTPLNGQIDELRFYDRALSAADILDDMTAPADASIPPQVTASTPAAGAFGVRAAVITATFSADMDASTLNDLTVQLETVSNGAPVPVSLAYEAQSRRLSIAPVSALSPLTEYRVTIGAVAASVGAIPMGCDFTWTFTTAAPNGMVAFYGFEEGGGTIAGDRTGNGHTGTLRHGPTWIPGRIGGALAFDGLDDRVDIKNAATLNMASALSISAWIKVTGTPTWKSIVTKHSSVAMSYQLAFDGSNRLRFYVHTAEGMRSAGAPALPSSEWVHVAGTYDGAALRLYVNGIETSVDWGAAPIMPNSGLLYIGSDLWNTAFPGVIDEVRLYDRAISVNEILSDMTLPVDPAAPLQVTRSTPADGAFGVRNTPVTVAFSAAMDPSTLTAATAVLEIAGGSAIAAQRSYDSPTRTLTVTPDTALPAATLLRLRIAGGAGGVSSTTSTTMSGDYTSTFTTAAANGVGGAWAFDEGAGTSTVDSTGNGNTGTLLNGPAWSSGRFGSALTFDGANDRVEIASADSLNLTAVTMSAWVRRTGSAPWSPILIKYDAAAAIRLSYGMWLDASHRLSAAVVVPGGTRAASMSTALPIGQWVYVVGTYDNHKVRLYVDGVLQSETDATGAIRTNNGPLWIGGNSWNESFPGQIDEVRVYDHALSVNEILNDMDEPANPDAELRVTAFTPPANAMGVRNAVISATFSAAMDPDSFTESTLMLESVYGEWTLYTIPSYDAATRTVTLTVDDWIEPLALHRVRIVGGVDGVRSESGMLLEEDVEWTFTAASDDGLGGAWGFEESSGLTTEDSSGNGNIGTLIGPSWSTGRYGGGLTFDGIDDRVRVADAETLDASDAVSIAAWIKPTGIGPLNVILSKESLSSGHSYALWLNSSGQLSANFELSDGVGAATTTDAIAVNAWTHVIATYDGSAIRLYVNGAEAVTESASGSFDNTARPLWIGGDQFADHYFAGHIDEVRLFDYALGTWEIEYLMSAPVRPVQTAGRIAGGDGHTLITKGDGTVWAWGENGNGQLGDRGTADRKSPIQISALSNIVAVAAGRNHSMALAADGTVFAWGSNTSGQIGLDTEGADQLTPVALPLTSVTAIAAGDRFSLVLRTNGEVYAFGRNVDGQFGIGSTAAAIAAPTLVTTGARAIAAGFNHSVLVKADGSVWTAGLNDSGQLGNGSTTRSTSWVEMVDITSAVAAAAGERHTVVLLSEGTLMSAGLNTSGQLGDSTTAALETTAVPMYWLAGVTVIEAGANHTMATTSDGTVWTWGENTSGQLGNDSTTFSREPLWQPFYTSYIGAGHQHSVAITPGGTVYAWGSNAYAQLGDGSASIVPRLAPAAISADDYAWRVATPEFSPDGGAFDNDQLVTLTSGTPDEPGAPVTIRYTLDGTDPTESSTVATGPVTIDHTLVLKARAWKGDMPASVVNARSFAFQAAQPTLGMPEGTYTSALEDVQFLSATQGAQIRYTTDLTAPTASSPLYSGPIDIAHTTTYRIAAFKNGYTRSAITEAQYTMNFGTLAAPIVEPAAGVHLGSVTMTTSTPEPGIVYYTLNPTTTAGDAPTSDASIASPVTFTTTATVRARSIHPDYATSADTTRTYVIKANQPTLSAPGGSYAPGSVVTITAGQPSMDTLRMTLDGSEPSDLSQAIASGTSMLLGNFTLKVRAFREDDDDIDSDTATAHYTLTGPMGPGSVSAGGAHSVLATPDGRVYTWGRNGNGQLGIDSTTDTSTPTLLNTITGVTSVSSGAAHTLARTWDGKMYSWGSNTSGRLGDGTSIPSLTPVSVPSLFNVVAVAAGDTHSLALTSNGRVYAWGENSDGQLGVGSTFDAWTPILIEPLSNIVAIAAGGTHSLAVTASGQLYAWGNNANARLGDGTTTDRTSPVLINLSDVVAVAAGGAHSIAMTSGGALYSWGLGTSGQLGHGAAASATTPQLIQGVHASAIAAGDSHSAAIRIDGALIAWGAGGSGQIGDGATSQRNAPAIVSGPASVSTLTLGDAHSIAVSPAGDIWTWGEVDFGRLGDAAMLDRVTPSAIAVTIPDWAPAAPTLSLASGAFATAQTVTIASSTAGAAIRYSSNGAEPTESDPELPASGVLDISSPTQLRAKVFAAGRAPGATARANYLLQPPAPIIDPPSGSYLTTQTVTIWGSGTVAILRYTLDGSDPTTSSTLYDVPFEVGVTTVVKAREFPANGWNPSATSMSSLVFNGGAMDLPTATPPGGFFLAAPQVALTSSAGASIRYTLNGTNPTASSTLYTGPITIPAAGATLKSIAFHATLPSSGIRTDVYVVDNTAPTITAQYLPTLINSWARSPVEVNFFCSDNRQIASCSGPMTFTEEGAGQTTTGIAVDSAGNQTQLPVTVNLDFTPPTVTISSPIDGSTTTNSTLQVTGQVVETLSGLASIKCNDVNATVVNDAISCQIPLRPGRNVVVISARDVAGNATSQGVIVTLVGTVTSLTMTPNARTMLPGETATLSVRDAFGVKPDNLSWSTSNSAIVSLSGDDPPVLTALAPGTANITAWKGSIGAQAQITVVAPDSEGKLPVGTRRWRLPTVTSTQWRRTAPIYTRRLTSDGPDFFTVEPNFTGSFWQYTVRAVSAEGAVLWKEAAPGLPLMGDAYGAVIAGVEEGAYRCAIYFGEDRFCFKALVRFGTSGTALPWRYDSAGYLDRPAQGPDGTIYVIEHINGSRSVGDSATSLADPGGNKSVVILNGETGQVIARVALPPETSTGPNGVHYFEPKTVGPVVNSDGNAYLLLRKQDTANGSTSESWNLIGMSREGQFSSKVVSDCPGGPCAWTQAFQLLPDGTGGLLIRVRRMISNQQSEGRLIRFDKDWNRTEHVIGLDTRVELVGEGGTVYLQSRTGTDQFFGVTQALDITTMTPRWTASPGWRLVSAKPDGGATATGSAGEVLDIDASGQLTSTLSAGVMEPVHVSGSVVGQGTAEVQAITVQPRDATQFNVRLTRVGVAFYEPMAFGNLQQQMAVPRCEPIMWTERWKHLEPGSSVSYTLAGTWAPDWKKTEIDAAFKDWTDANKLTTLNTSFTPTSGKAMVTLRNLPLLPQNGKPVAGGINYHKTDANGVLIEAVVVWTTETKWLSSPDGYRKVTLHEIGHLLGLADTNGTGGSSVMNQLSGKDDQGNNLPKTVTKCDRDAAWLSQFRSWP